MDECIDIWSSEYSYLESTDDWLSPVRGTYSTRVKSIDLSQWLNEAFYKPSYRPVISGTNGRINGNGSSNNNGGRVIDQRTRRIQPSPSRRPGIPNMGSFDTPPEQDRDVQRVIQSNTVTKVVGVERTKTFTRKREEHAFIKNATITKARIARRGTFSRGQMPFNLDCDELLNSHDITYNLNGNVDHDYNCDDNQIMPTSPSDFNDVFVNNTSTPHNQSAIELNRQGTITKRILNPSKASLIRPSNGHFSNFGINGQQSLMNASSAPNLHAARSREQISTTTNGTSSYNHGTITKSSSRILTRIPKSNSSSRESLLMPVATVTMTSTSNLPRLRPPQTMIKPMMFRKQ